MENNKHSKKYEPTISDLEWLIFEFRKNHGEAELSTLLEEITKNFPKKNSQPPTEKKEKGINLKFSNSPITETEENFLDEIKYNFANFTSKIQRGKKTESNFKKNLKEKFIKLIKNKYVKKIGIFLGLYLFLYLVINSPMYLERIKYTFNKTEKVKIMTEEVIKTPMANSAPKEAGEVIPSSGTKIIIPKIKAEAPVVFANSQEEKLIQNDLKKGVVKYSGTAKPGEVGNTFIVGHSSGYFWDNSPYKYAFVLLDKMEKGDEAKIYHNGRKFVYKVSEKQIVEPTDVSVLKRTDEPYLTLMTCYPPGTTSKRLIVKLKQTSPEYIKPKIVLKEKEIEVPKMLPTSDNRSFLDRLIFFWR